MMPMRQIHVVHLLIRRPQADRVALFVAPHDNWLDSTGQPYLTLPTKRTVAEPCAPFLQGSSLEEFVDAIAREDLGLGEDDYVLEQEIEPAAVELESPSRHALTAYTVYPIDVWVAPSRHNELTARTNGQWLTCEKAVAHPQISPTTRAVMKSVQFREQRLDALYEADPALESRPEAARRLLRSVPSHPSMDGLAKKWFSRNKRGVRHLTSRWIDHILDAGSRAFNLRVADPYLRYQMQGQGFTWSFFSHKDPQDCHVHGAPIVEIYGILKGRLEVWWKPYYDRGTSAWNHRILEAGDWLEVDSLQCHVVRWLGEGQGVVFKAGPGPLAEVGKLGVKGKTPCKDCPCMKPQQVVECESAGGQ